MPRYFFNVIDGHSSPDAEGIVLPDLDSAKAAAVILSGEILQDLGLKFWRLDRWRLQVADEGGVILFALQFKTQPA